MSNRYTHTFRYFYAFLDLLFMNLVFICMTVFLNKVNAAAEKRYLYLFMAGNIFWLCASLLTALYLENAAPSSERFGRKTLQTYILFNFFMLGFLFFSHFQYSRIFMVCSFSAFLIVLALSRITLTMITHYLNKAPRITKRIVIIGYNEIAKSLVERFASQRKNFQLEGFFENESEVKELTTHPIIGDIDECLVYAKAHNVQEIYSTISPETNYSLYEMAKTAERSLIRFKFVPNFKLYVNRNTHMEYLSDIPILSLRPEPLEDLGNATKKRIFDIVFSILTIGLLLSWVIPIIAILIKLTSKGPIFFIQSRSGKNNRDFKCLKFRTLVVNRDANIIQVTKNDSRITPFGRFLRKTNLDELPQFFNVLIGDMSVVGPRPHMLKHTTSFSEIMEEYMLRHFVKPGVTGWAQVNGYRGEIKENNQLKKRLEYDIWYMENWSLYLDLRIIWLTVYTTLIGDKNAY